MLDPQYLRKHAQVVAAALAQRGMTGDWDHFTDLENRRKQLQVEVQGLQNARNQGAKNIGIARANRTDTSAQLAQMQSINQQLDSAQCALQEVQQQLHQFQLGLPNIPDSGVPLGEHESHNVELRRWGDVPEFPFSPRAHQDLFANDGMDFATASRLSGSRFVLLQGAIARLHRALAQWMLDVQTREHGYLECYVPYLVHEQVVQGTGQLPKFAEDLFVTKDGRYLIPTAEVPLTNLVRETILEATQLPLKFTAHTPCFRAEAGSYGKDTKGILRQHQFDKVEMVQIVRPEDSPQTLETMTVHAENLLQQLCLPYRVVALCSGDLGFAAAKTYDLEVWLPGQQRYREISSISNCTDFQARRMQARWRNPQSGKPELVHTLNGSGLAVGRALIAVLENYQQSDGSVMVPKVLQAYMAPPWRERIYGP